MTVPELTHLRIQDSDELSIVTIDRPEKLNALNRPIVRELAEAFRFLRSREGLRGVILRGAGEKAFVAGADISGLRELDPLTAVRVSEEGQDAFRLIESFPHPVLAEIGGFALGGGFELAMACHLRVASDDARFGLPEVGLGLLPGYGGTVRLARLIGLGRAVEWTLTGDLIGAEEALRIGIVSRVVPRAELHATSLELIRRVTRRAPLAVSLALQSIYGAGNLPIGEALRIEAQSFGLLAGTRDAREGMTAFLEKRSPSFEGR